MPDRYDRHRPEHGYAQPPHDASARRDLRLDGHDPRSPYRGPSERPPRRKSRLVTFTLNAALVLATVAVAVVTFLAIAPPTDLVRDHLIAEVRQRTGRELAIAGPTRFTLLPSLGLSATDISLSAPREMPGAPLLVAEKLEVSIAALPMLLREAKIERLVLHRPHFNLRVDTSGRRSWDFAAASDLPQDGRVRLAQAAPRSETRSASELEAFARNATTPVSLKSAALAGVNGVSLSDLKIVNGRVSWSDARSGARHDVDGIDATVSLPDPAGPLDLRGTLLYAGERFDVGLKLASPLDAAAARETKVHLTLAGKPLRADYQGLLTAGPTPAIDGRLSIASPSAGTLSHLANLELTGAEDVGLALEGQIKGQPQNFVFSSALLTFGDTRAQGRIAIDTTTPRPQIQTALKIPRLDFDQIANLSLRPLRASPPASGPPARAAPASVPPARSIEDLIERSQPPPANTGKPATAVRGFTRRANEPWSVEPIATAALRTLDVDGRFDIDSLSWQQLEIGPSQTAVVLKAGVLKASVTDAQLYGGRAKGLLNVDGKQDTVVVGLNFSADGVMTQPLLGTLAGIDSIDGRGRIIVAVSAQGASERDLVSTLNGRAEMVLADGAVIGWSAADITANLVQGRVPKLDRNPSARTPFTELAISLPISNGVGRTQDFRLRSAQVEASGGGTVNLVDRNLDMTIKPKAVGSSGLAGVEIPVRLAGPWGEIRAIPDLNTAMKSPQAQEAMRNIGKQIQNGDVDGALRSVLGDNPKTDEKIGKAKDALKQFLGR